MQHEITPDDYVKVRRVNRAEYLKALILFGVLPIIGIYFLSQLLTDGTGVLGLVIGVLVLPPLILVVSVILIYAFIVLNAKRLHDVDRSAYWQLFLIIPTLTAYFGLPMTLPILSAMILVLASIEGTRGDNQYGPPT